MLSLKSAPIIAALTCTTVFLCAVPPSIANPTQDVQKLHFSKVSPAVKASYDRGLAKINQKDYQGAIAEFDRALKEQPNYPEALNWRGSAYRALGSAEKALADFNRAIQLKPDYSRPYNNRAVLKRAQKNLQGALADFNEAIRLEPTLSVFYMNRAALFLDLDNVKNAIGDFRAVVKLAPNDAKSYDALCKAEILDKNNRAALDACSRSISMGYQGYEVYHNRGIANMRLQLMPAATKDFNQAIELAPQMGLPYELRSNVREQDGDLQGALQDLETAVRLYQTSGEMSKKQISDVEKEVVALRAKLKK